MSETIPIISLQRALRLLLIVYGSCMLTALLAGAALVAHVDPFSECLLYSYVSGGKLFFGEEAYCETIGYLFLGCIIGAMVLFYLTLKHLRQIRAFYKSGQLMRGHDDLLKLNKRNMMLHLLGTGMVLLLTIAMTSGYVSACDNIGDFVNVEINSKLTSNNEVRERIDEKFDHDNTFWRYTGRVNNAYGTFSVVRRINCRAIFTDPHIHQQLHETHVEKYSSYFGYWYQQDLNAFDPSSQAVMTNALIEASLAGGWLSVLLWAGSFIFMLVQRFYLKKEKREMDKVSLHSNMDGTLRKDEMSIISGYQHSFQRGGLRGSDRSFRSMKSLTSRRDMDDLAFAVHGVNTPVNPQMRYAQSYPDQSFNPSVHMGVPMQQQAFLTVPGASSHQGFNGNAGNFVGNQGARYSPNNQMSMTPRSLRANQRHTPGPEMAYTDRSNAETEIM